MDPAVQRFPFLICRVGEDSPTVPHSVSSGARTDLGGCGMGDRQSQLPLTAFEGLSQARN